jgi:predicted aldo/keto reductase-like oxidoreductase
MTKRNQLLNQMSLASIARQYTHYISQIDIGHAVMDEKEAIEEQLSVFSAHDEIRKKIMEAVVTHLEKNVISIVAAPVLQCDNCGKSTKDEAIKTNFTNAVPLDTIQLFFVLFLQILMQLKDR